MRHHSYQTQKKKKTRLLAQKKNYKNRNKELKSVN